MKAMMLMLGAACVLICLLFIKQDHDFDQYIREKEGYSQLSSYALEMIENHEAGVYPDENSNFGGYIISFDAFFQYVRKRNPDVVANADADNPFPGLLPGKKYGRTEKTSSSKDHLFWSVESLSRPYGDAQYRLFSDGYIQRDDTSGRYGTRRQ